VNRLKFERVNRRLSQERLALLTRIPQPIISLAENGVWNLTASQRAALAGVLDVPGEQLQREVNLADAEVPA